jgi:hypothetical protein
MPAFTTFAEAQAELIATADYDVEADVAKAKRYVAAARALITFNSLGTRDGTTLQFDMQQIANLMNQAIAYVAANSTPSEAQRLANPSVVHADWSGFGNYGANGPPGACP